jgi:hypothetical protein
MQESLGFSLVSISKDNSLDEKFRDSFFTKRRVIFPIYIFIFSFAEILAVVDPLWGFIAHCFSIPLIGIHVSVCHRIDQDSSKLALALSPIPLVRIVSIASPVVQFTILQWFLVISMVLFSSILITIVLIGDEMSDYGFKMPSRKHYPLELAIIFCGLIFGYVEYQILSPTSLVETLTLVGLIAPLVALYLGTGLLEELLFRGVIQRHSIDSLGKWQGIIFTNLIFMILHTGWESGLDLIFVGIVGVIFSIVVERTGSIIGVSFSHAITNLSLFVLTPELIS